MLCNALKFKLSSSFAVAAVTVAAAARRLFAVQVWVNVLWSHGHQTAFTRSVSLCLICLSGIVSIYTPSRQKSHFSCNFCSFSFFTQHTPPLSPLLPPQVSTLYFAFITSWVSAKVLVVVVVVFFFPLFPLLLFIPLFTTFYVVISTRVVMMICRQIFVVCFKLPLVQPSNCSSTWFHDHLTRHTHHQSLLGTPFSPDDFVVDVVCFSGN